ncbi:uncharacterized protein LOC107044059 [Diachasma alloeum]|uniref:uncharacterized protein LOC107044059 n=1 Tax=Diachasma alloeum TaxID=454923 RepID=UPI0007382C64|nr:uncharacterized protein LOC107044059 [Diachasma alloeum]
MLPGKFDSVCAEFADVKAKLSALDLLPPLVKRVDDVESTVAGHTEEIQSLKQTVAELVEKSNAPLPLAPVAPLPPLDTNTMQRVVAGFPESEALTDPLPLALAVLHTVKQDLDPTAVSNVRFLRKSGNRADAAFLPVAQPLTYHIIVITESWLSPSIPSSVLNIPNYSLLRYDRNVNGGGVAIYYHASVNASVISFSTSVWTEPPGHVEYLFCEVLVPNSSPIFVAAIYRPPHSPFHVPVNFTGLLSTFLDGYSHKIIMGDFNADQLSERADAVYIRTLMSDLSLKLVDNGITHTTLTSSTWLDLCLTDECDSITGWFTSEVPMAAGHHLISASISINGCKPRATTISTRQLSALQWVDVVGDFESTLQSALASDFGTDDLAATFTNVFLALVEAHAPLRQVKVNAIKTAPWLSDDLRLSDKHVQHLYRRFKRNRSQERLVDFRLARSLHQSLLLKARVKYYHTRLSGLTGASLWRELRSLALIAGSSKSLTISTDDLNAHYSAVSIVSSEDPLLPPSRTVFTDALFPFSQVSWLDIKTAISSIKSDAVGADCISRR